MRFENACDLRILHSVSFVKCFMEKRKAWCYFSFFWQYINLSLKKLIDEIITEAFLIWYEAGYDPP